MKCKNLEGDRHSVYEQIFSESEASREMQVLLIKLDFTEDPFSCHVLNFDVQELNEIIEEITRDRRNLTASKLKSLKNAYQEMLEDPEQKSTVLIIETRQAQFFNIHINQTLKEFIEACDFALFSSTNF